MFDYVLFYGLSGSSQSSGGAGLEFWSLKTDVFAPHCLSTLVSVPINANINLYMHLKCAKHTMSNIHTYIHTYITSQNHIY